MAADWYHETVTFDAIPDAATLNSYHIYFASHYDRQYYDNMAVYYFPKRSYILNIGGTLSLVTDADDVVTLPTGENYVSFLCGRNRLSCRFAGEFIRNRDEDLDSLQYHPFVRPG